MASNNAGSASSTGAAAGASGSAHNKDKDQEKTFVVDSVDMVSDQCKSAGSASSASNTPSPK